MPTQTEIADRHPHVTAETQFSKQTSVYMAAVVHGRPPEGQGPTEARVGDAERLRRRTVLDSRRARTCQHEEEPVYGHPTM